MKGPRFYGLLQHGKRLQFNEGGTGNSLKVTYTMPCPKRNQVDDWRLFLVKRQMELKGKELNKVFRFFSAFLARAEMADKLDL